MQLLSYAASPLHSYSANQLVIFSFVYLRLFWFISLSEWVLGDIGQSFPELILFRALVSFYGLAFATINTCQEILAGTFAFLREGERERLVKAHRKYICIEK